MSYTMTIEAPEKVAWFEQRRAKFSPEMLGDLFVTFLMEQTPDVLEEAASRTVSPRVHALRGVVRLPEDFDERSFARFAGRWTDEEAKSFDELTKRTVDEEDWQ